MGEHITVEVTGNFTKLKLSSEVTYEMQPDTNQLKHIHRAYVLLINQ